MLAGATCLHTEVRYGTQAWQFHPQCLNNV
jgi:hypothetical protein